MGEVRDGTKALFFCFPLKFNGLFRERGGLTRKREEASVKCMKGMKGTHGGRRGHSDVHP